MTTSGFLTAEMPMRLSARPCRALAKKV